MRRREFITLVGCAAAWPVTARAQRTGKPLIGFVSSRSPRESEGVVAAFRQGLRQTGFVEGENLAIEFRWAEGRFDRLPTLAAELINLRVALIFSAGGAPAAFAVKEKTSSIPIVFSAVGDPVEIGLVPSLSQPGSNITGMAVFNGQLAEKRIELAKELVPDSNVIGYLIHPSDQMSQTDVKGAQAASRAIGIELRLLHASSEADIEAAIASMKELGAGTLVVSGEPFFDSRRDMIAALALRHSVAGVYAWREYVLAGGLASYGTDLPDSYRQAAIYAGRILRGERPANLPVVQPTKFHLAVSLRTARALGLEVPPALLARADEVID